TAIQGSDLEFNVVSNDKDPNFNLDPTSVHILTHPAEGNASVDPETGLITYAHSGTAAGGVDSFTYEVADIEGLTTEATVTVSIERQTAIKEGRIFPLPPEGTPGIPLTIGPNGIWHQRGGNDDTELLVEGNRIVVSNQSDNDFRRVIAKLSLNSGEKLDLSNPGSSLSVAFRLRLREYEGRNEEENDRRFRFGFVDSGNGGKGYFVRADAGQAEGVAAGLSKNGNFFGGSSTQLSSTMDAAFAAENGRIRDYQFELRRFAPDLLTLTLKVDGKTLGAADAVETLSTFDTFGFSIPSDLGDAASTDGNGAVAEISNVEIRYGGAVAEPVAPVARPDTAELEQGASAVIAILSNDYDLNLDLTGAGIAITTPPAEGSILINREDGVLTYAHRGGLTSGNDDFVYQLTDEGGNQSEATPVNITITPLTNPTLSSTLPLEADGAISPVTPTVGANGHWRIFGSTEKATLSVTPDHVLFRNLSDSDDNADDFRRIGFQLSSGDAPISLRPVGSKLSVSFSMNLENYRPRPSDDVDRRFRFGFWNVSGRGYFARMDLVAGLGASLDFRKGGNQLGGSSQGLGEPRIDQEFILDGDVRRYQLTVERINTDDLEVTLSVSHGEKTIRHTMSDTAAIIGLLDFCGLMVPKDGDGVDGLIRDVEVSYLRGESIIAPMEFFGEWMRNASEVPEEERLPLRNADGDAYTNLEEYALGGDPIRQATAPLLGLSTMSGSGNFGVSFKRRRDWKERGLIYEVETSTDLVNWESVGGISLTEPASEAFDRALVPLDASFETAYARVVVALENQDAPPE
ncbi:MAG: Ig-like domain-containing protein, partial [Verrucomicrobiota bacterium]